LKKKNRNLAAFVLQTVAKWHGTQTDLKKM
jgi:hypothetical protein